MPFSFVVKKIEGLTGGAPPTDPFKGFQRVSKPKLRNRLADGFTSDKAYSRKQNSPGARRNERRLSIESQGSIGPRLQPAGAVRAPAGANGVCASRRPLKTMELRRTAMSRLSASVTEGHITAKNEVVSRRLSKFERSDTLGPRGGWGHRFAQRETSVNGRGHCCGHLLFRL